MFYSKDGISVAPVIDSSHPKQNGLYPIKIRVTYRRKRKYYPTSKSLTIEQWNNINSAKSHALIAVRKDIENSYNIVRSVVEDLASTGYFSLEMLNMRLRGATSHTVNTAFRAKIEALKESGQAGTMMCYDTVLKGLERFSNNHINFADVTVAWVGRYADFLRKENKAQTTISIHLRTLRAILNEAKRNGIIRESQYPFGRGRYEIQEGEGRKMALTVEQIGMIAKYDDGNEATAKYRDYWLFLYLCNGINVADFVKLKFRDIINGEICFVRQKTERTTKTRKEICVIVSERMQDIIDRRGNSPAPNQFIFPILNGQEDAFTLRLKTKYLTRAINKRMAEIGKKLGIGNISTYTARHSFATVLKRAGVNIAYISESLGHSDLKTTENYLASFEREEREKNAQLLTQF
ncbi:site-specific integrase [uncultured Alistipes sp.]|uniref:site-specific integrase n=1 Tax=uncultured Alistipes sp. TaxID=538949 RepID=UPI002615C155|nr:site-specific integrase [uncultured Alistipes sp.]